MNNVFLDELMRQQQKYEAKIDDSKLSPLVHSVRLAACLIPVTRYDYNPDKLL